MVELRWATLLSEHHIYLDVPQETAIEEIASSLLRCVATRSLVLHHTLGHARIPRFYQSTRWEQASQMVYPTFTPSESEPILTPNHSIRYVTAPASVVAVHGAYRVHRRRSADRRSPGAHY